MLSASCANTNAPDPRRHAPEIAQCMMLQQQAQLMGSLWALRQCPGSSVVVVGGILLCCLAVSSLMICLALQGGD